jgi:hypothetical protein
MHAISAGASKPDRTGRLERLRQLNWFLWFCWLGLPAFVFSTYWRITYRIPATFADDAAAPNCLRVLGHPGYMSASGRAVFWGEYLFETSIVFIALWMLHRMVRRFISGQIFVEQTLAGLKSLGLVLIVWPFLVAAARIGEDAALKALADRPQNWPVPFNVQLGIAAFGMLLLALKIVVEYAIEIKSDQELTI